MVGLGMATRASQFPLTFRGCTGVNLELPTAQYGSDIANLLQLCSYLCNDYRN